MGTGWNHWLAGTTRIAIITDWDMGTGWNNALTAPISDAIITDWDMGTGWNLHHEHPKTL